MPSAHNPPQSQALRELSKSHQRRRRMINIGLVMIGFGIFLTTYLTTALLPAVGVTALLLITARAPLFESSGTTRLRTNIDPEAVVEQFTSTQPPVLAYQWSTASGVTATEDGATYEFSSLFSRQVTVLKVHTQRESCANGNHRIKIIVSTAKSQWGTYRVTVSRGESETIVEVDYDSEQPFGLRRVPHQLFGDQFHNAALEKQGYRVVDREKSVRPR